MRLIILIGMLLSISLSMAQELTVIDKTTKDPVEFAQVGSKGSTKMLITDANGKVDITPFVGLSDIIIRLYGYEALEFDYSELEARNFQVEMEPRSEERRVGKSVDLGGRRNIKEEKRI